MNAFSRKLERFCYKHPRFGIPNLMLYIVIGNLIVYLLSMIDRTGLFPSYLVFSPHLILQGQIWRLFTFIFFPVSGNLFLTAISLYFYYFIGRTLEREWGTAKFTIFYLSGVLFHIVGGMIIGLLTNSALGLTGHYLNLSMFFAFASLYPDMQVLLFFFIPIKMKWLALVDAAYFIYGIIRLSPALYKLIPVIAILNYLLFFSGDLVAILRRKLGRRPKKTVHFRSAAQAAKENKGYLHKCAVCGKTDTDYPNLEFRYCSKCNGYYCYCEDHIHNHIHIE